MSHDERDFSPDLLHRRMAIVEDGSMCIDRVADLMNKFTLSGMEKNLRMRVPYDLDLLAIVIKRLERMIHLGLSVTVCRADKVMSMVQALVEQCQQSGLFAAKMYFV